MFSLTDKVAIVTGASRGIGKTIAETFANAGAHVVCAARTTNAIQAVAIEINSNGASASHTTCDISDKESFTNLVQTTVQEHERLDILVNNAGVTRDALLMRMKDEDWDTVLNINLKGAYHGMKAAIRPMIKNRNGRIINITSIVGLTGNPGQANYAASMSGLIGMTKSVAKEVATRGITVNCIAPGLVKTDFAKALYEDPEVEKAKSSVTPMRRLGVPEDLAGIAVYLASKAGAWTTGQTFCIDGGITSVGG